jgi:hypothetical protein
MGISILFSFFQPSSKMLKCFSSIILIDLFNNVRYLFVILKDNFFYFILIEFFKMLFAKNKYQILYFVMSYTKTAPAADL